jgi:hypothetical protein
MIISSTAAASPPLAEPGNVQLRRPTQTLLRRPLGPVVVELQAAVFGEARQRLPVIEHILHRRAQLRPWHQAHVHALQQPVEPIEDRQAAALARGGELVRRQPGARPTALELVQRAKVRGPRNDAQRERRANWLYQDRRPAAGITRDSGGRLPEPSG